MAPDRRTLLRAGLVVTALGAAGAVARTAFATETTETTGDALRPPRLDGQFRSDPEALGSAAEDFGHVLHRRPRGVIAPGSARDVATSTKWAGDQRLRITAQGEGHSVYGRSQADRGIVVDMTKLHSVHSVGTDRVVVDAGAKWSEVLAATLPKGLTPPVLTDYLELSVGGTIVVGGIGGTTWRHGMQSDNVLEMDVVTGRGDTVTCSPKRNADLFNAVRAGLGQVGIITRATLKLVAAPEKARRYTLTYPDLATLLADQRKLLAERRFDYLQGAILPTPAGTWKFTLEGAALFSGSPEPDDATKLAGLSDIRSAAQIATLGYFDYLNRLAPLEALLRANGQWGWPHPWLTTYVGDSKVESVVGSELAKLTPADVGTYGRVVVSPLYRKTVTSPLLRLPSDEVSFTFNLLRFPPDDAALASRMVTHNREVYERVRAAGGTLYPVSAFPMSSDDWRQHFGTAWSQLHDAKQCYDPHDILTPGYEVF